MKINIRKGEAKDIQATHALIRELAVFLKAEEELANTPERMLEDCFGEKPLFHFFVAEIDSEIAGIAVCFYSYSTWKGKCLYLEDLVVKESFRRHGIGELLINKLVQEAKENQCARLHWQVLDWNESAIKFYEKLNAHFERECVNCKIKIGS